MQPVETCCSDLRMLDKPRMFLKCFQKHYLPKQAQFGFSAFAEDWDISGEQEPVSL